MQNPLIFPKDYDKIIHGMSLDSIYEEKKQEWQNKMNDVESRLQDLEEKQKKQNYNFLSVTIAFFAMMISFLTLFFTIISSQSKSCRVNSDNSIISVNNEDENFEAENITWELIEPEL